MEHTSSLTPDRDRSATSRLTVSRVRPICRRKETPWKDSRDEWVGLGPLTLPLDRRPHNRLGGLAEGDGGTGDPAAGTGNGLGNGTGDELPHVCILYVRWFYPHGNSSMS